MSITVRPIAAGDEVRWRELFDGYIKFYRAQVPEKVIALTWRRCLDGEDGMVALLAEETDGRPVGLAHLVFHRSTWSPTCYCYLEDLFVAPAARGQGVGRALIAAAYGEADKRGATRTYWATDAGNDQARKLYDAVAKLSPFVQYRR